MIKLDIEWFATVQLCNWLSRLNFGLARVRSLGFGGRYLVYLIFLDNVLYLVVLLDIDSPRSTIV